MRTVVGGSAVDVDGDVRLPRARRGDNDTQKDTATMIAMSETIGAPRGSGEARLESRRRNKLQVEDGIDVLAAPKIERGDQEVR